MIIVCTQDPAVRNNQSGAANWGAFNLLTPGGQPGATVQLGGFLEQLGEDEALCLSAHGNNTEIGDPARPGWEWNVSDIATLLTERTPEGYEGPILIHACATSVVNFSANLAQELRNQGALIDVWIYGYNRALGTGESYPAPANLDTNVSLQGTQV